MSWESKSAHSAIIAFQSICAYLRGMSRYCLFIALFCAAGCALNRFPVKGPRHASLLDVTCGASTPISEEQALAVARVEVAKREHWPEGQLAPDRLIHTVCYQAERMNSGGWKVVAHRAVKDNRPGYGDCGFDAIPAAIIIVNKRGAVTSYTKERL
jgi:hypothetical protein